MKNIRIFLTENFHFLVVKFSVYLNRRVFVMSSARMINSFLIFFFFFFFQFQLIGRSVPTKYAYFPWIPDDTPFIIGLFLPV